MTLATPLGIIYYTPLMDNLDHMFPDITPDITAQSLFSDCVSANMSLFGNTDVLHLGRIRTYDSTVQHITTHKVVYEHGPHARTPGPLQHRHQLGTTSITYRGYCSSKETPERMLWRGKNMATSLSPILLKLNVMPTGAVLGTSAQSSAPRFGTATTQDTVMDQRLIDYLAYLMQQHQVFRSMLRLNQRDCRSWMQPWQPMTVPEKASACSLANEMLGDLSLPYPEMDIVSVIVIFERSTSARGPVLARLSLGIDAKRTRNDCGYCNDGLLVIESLDSDSAVKINVPVTSNGDQHIYSNLQDFTKNNVLKKCNVISTWSKIAYDFQGFSHLPIEHECTRCGKGKSSAKTKPMTDEGAEVWDGNAQSDEDDAFEPFPIKCVFDDASHESGCRRTEFFVRDSDEESDFEAFPEDEKSDFEAFPEDET